jgi:hypothetical protein
MNTTEDLFDIPALVGDKLEGIAVANRLVINPLVDDPYLAGGRLKQRSSNRIAGVYVIDKKKKYGLITILPGGDFLLNCHKSFDKDPILAAYPDRKVVVADNLRITPSEGKYNVWALSAAMTLYPKDFVSLDVYANNWRLTNVPSVTYGSRSVPSFIIFKDRILAVCRYAAQASFAANVLNILFRLGQHYNISEGILDLTPNSETVTVLGTRFSLRDDPMVTLRGIENLVRSPQAVNSLGLTEVQYITNSRGLNTAADLTWVGQNVQHAYGTNIVTTPIPDTVTTTETFRNIPF